MTETWATSGLDLHLPASGPRARAALEEALREAVVSGRLAPGSRLPSSRGLAADLGVARNTVAEAYSQLVAEGWLVARQGSGTRVAEAVVRAPARPRGEPGRPGTRFTLRPGHPDVSTFPRSAWVKALRRALVTAPNATLAYGDPRGTIELRRALAAYLGRVRGVRTTPEQLMICTGTTQTLALLGELIAQQSSRRIALEEWGPAHLRQVLTRRGLRTLPLPVDDSGAVLRDLPDLDAAALMLTPAHQFPAGVPLSPDRRAQALGWARDADALVVEDDYDGEFRYDRQPVGALQPHAPDRVVYCGTTSKTLAPGVRLGWLALPEDLLEPMVEAKRLADHQTSSLDQLALAELISSGQYDRHIRRARHHYRRRRDALVAAITARVPTVRITGIAAGQHLLVRLPGEPADAVEVESGLVQQARQRGLALESLSTYRHPDAGPHAPALVIGYGSSPDHAFPGAVEVLCRVLKTIGR